MSREMGIAINRLRDHSARVVALDTIPAQIETLELQYGAIRSATTDSEPVSGGTNRREDMLVANILKREALKNDLEIAKREIEITNKALAVLSGDERRILELFYINRQSGYIDRLCDELCVERSRVYTLKDEALRKFCLAICGTVDL